MKTINLKKYYYPICKKDTFVEVPDEVADAIVEESRAENANDAKAALSLLLSGRFPRHRKPFPGTGRFPGRYSDGEGNGTGTGGRPRPDDGTAPGGPCHPDAPAGKLPSCPVLGGQAVQGDCRGRRLHDISGHCHGSQRHYQVTEILYQARLDEAAKGESDMHKDSTTQAKQKKDEREEVLKEIRQLENRQKILENKQRNEERKARTRRLIERGAILEGIFPLAPDLPGVEVKAFLIALSHLPGAAELAAKLPKSGDKP